MNWPMTQFEPVVTIAVAALYPSGWPSTEQIRLVTHQLSTNAVMPRHRKPHQPVMDLWTLGYPMKHSYRTGHEQLLDRLYPTEASYTLWYLETPPQSLLKTLNPVRARSAVFASVDVREGTRPRERDGSSSVAASSPILQPWWPTRESASGTLFISLLSRVA